MVYTATFDAATGTVTAEAGRRRDAQRLDRGHAGDRARRRGRGRGGFVYTDDNFAFNYSRLNGGMWSAPSPLAGSGAYVAIATGP